MPTVEFSGTAVPPADFLAAYYDEVPREDREPYDTGRLESRAVAHFRSGLTRTPGAEAWVGLIPDKDSAVLGVVTDDAPFMVDSVLAEVTRRGLGIHLVVHPTFSVVRDPGGRLTAITPATRQQESLVETWICVEISDSLRSEDVEALLDGIRRVISDVRLVVRDWQKMRRKAVDVAEALPDVPAERAGHGIEIARSLLRWLTSNHFVFIGYRAYELIRGPSEDHLKAVEGTGLGILSHGDARPRPLTETARKSLRRPPAFVVTKANSKSTVHRDAHLDYIGIKTYDAAGEVTGEHRFLGLFTSSVYNGPVEDMPVVADKIKAVIAQSGLASTSYSGRHLISVLETYPPDELFQIGVGDLYQKTSQIMRMQERRRCRVFLRADSYGRFVTALVYLPRDRYNTSVRIRVEDELRQVFAAVDVEHEARVTSSALARIFFTVWLPPGEIPSVAEADLERRVSRAVRSWPEGILDVLREIHPGPEAETLSKRWGESFPAEYRVQYSVEDARADITRLEQLDSGGPAPAARLYVDPRQPWRPEGNGRMRLYLREPESLTHILPFFEHLGLEVLEERPYEIVDSGSRTFFLYDLSVRYPVESSGPQALALVPDAFSAALTGLAESDLLDGLVLRQGFPWRIVSLLRSYAKYWRQLGTSHSFDFMASTLLAHPLVTRELVTLFSAKFDPDMDGSDREWRVRKADAAVTEAVSAVPTLDAGFVLETFASLIRATVRTNFYQDKEYISTKFDPSAIEVLPKPRPTHEVWVYSPRIEGVHLRFGKTARGGLRWSDRKEDFRTEVLGLVKAQAVKNAVIVPDGAKGGFYSKAAAGLAGREQLLAEGQECYRIFIRGLLDITDNIHFEERGQLTIPPPRVVRYDGDDPYLVVAADKGTAAFSDIANGVAGSYDYWLGDAFASGGSVGYDHKRMGITARGAWESVRSHFSEIGIDPQASDFTAAGIGDMSGDVFGNAMLLSRHIRLVAAFDHRHIFLDPEPDAAASFDERQRLFSLPRSTWDDYDRSLISPGGGVWPRDARRIPLSPPAAEALGIDPAVESISPPDLLRAILIAPVDLLYNGGIGTYIKAAGESHANAGDRVNDAFRINGNEVRARVVVEGGNLGVTQAGRVEAALNGVLINTDAIDNSAGVDCSDHEVNIKILLAQEIRAGRLPAAERAQFLDGLTAEVADLVLSDNTAQNALLLTERRCPPAAVPSYERLMQFLEGKGELDRRLEGLPDSQTLEERIARGNGLTSPELAVLAAYSKNILAAAVRSHNLIRDPYFESVLRRYFPDPVVARFGAQLNLHPLRDDIIATVVANETVNIGGITAVFRLMEETSSDEAGTARAFVIANEVFRLRELTSGLVGLGAELSAEKRSRIHLDIQRALDTAMRWFIQHDHHLPVADCVQLYRPVVETLRHRLAELLVGSDKLAVLSLLDTAREWRIPESIAMAWAELHETLALLNIARVQQVTAKPLEVVAPTYFAVHNRFRIEEILNRIDGLPSTTKWQAMGRASLREDLSTVVPELTVAVLARGSQAPVADQVSDWEERHHDRLLASQRLLESAPAGSFEALTTHVGTLRKAAGS